MIDKSSDNGLAYVLQWISIYRLMMMITCVFQTCYSSKVKQFTFMQTEFNKVPQ